MNRWLARALIVILGCAAYSNSLHGSFILDDASIARNPAVRGLFAHRAPGQVPDAISARPVVTFTFQLNYVAGGLNTFGYHLVNLLIHLGAGLLVFEIVRVNLSDPRVWGDRFRYSSPLLALAVSAVWIVHPLNTEAVTYIVQRTESMAGLCYLATIYCLIRAATSAKFSAQLSVLAILACAVGMGTKETIASAPLMALLYDRTFLAGSFRQALRMRKWFYAGLACTWIIVAISIYLEKGAPTLGFHLRITPISYARTELDVIAYYIRLVFWPHPLSVDYYDWPVSSRWADVGIGGWVVLILTIATPVALWKKPWLGFLGSWMFLILAPSSSFVPLITEIAAERRMYLPMLAVIALAIIGGWAVLRQYRLGMLAGIAVAISLVLSLGILCFDRNELYISEIDLLRDAARMRPNNPRAWLNIAAVQHLASSENPDGAGPAISAASESADAYGRVLQLEPSNFGAWQNWGPMLERAQRWTEAEQAYTSAIVNVPEMRAIAYQQRGWLRARRGDYSDAIVDYDASLSLKPADAKTQDLLTQAQAAVNQPQQPK